MATCNPNALLLAGKDFLGLDEQQSAMALLQLLCDVSAGINPASQAAGAPSAPPATPSRPAFYTNLSNGRIYTWNVASQAWLATP